MFSLIHSNVWVDGAFSSLRLFVMCPFSWLSVCNKCVEVSQQWQICSMEYVLTIKFPWGTKLKHSVQPSCTVVQQKHVYCPVSLTSPTLHASLVSSTRWQNIWQGSLFCGLFHYFYNHTEWAVLGMHLVLLITKSAKKAIFNAVSQTVVYWEALHQITAKSVVAKYSFSLYCRVQVLMCIAQ